MSGKYLNNNKKKKAKKKKSNLGLIILLLILIAAAAALVVFLATGAGPAPAETQGAETQTQPARQENPENQDVPESEAPVMESEPTETQGKEFGTAQEQPNDTELPIDLGEGLVLTKIASYAGLYLEDGSDEVVTGILMVELENTTEEDLQLANITLTYAEGTAAFTVSNLPAGKKVVLLEKNRMAYTSQALQSAVAENIVFLEAFEMYEDQLKIVAHDGVINVQNISEEDISGDIFVYYKNISGGVYYGGITYRVRIEGGLKAGEIRQMMTQHYDADGSEILMVSYG